MELREGFAAQQVRCRDGNCLKFIVGLLALLVIGGASFGLGIGMGGNAASQRVETLAAENQQLRLFNARETRRYRHPDAKVRWEAVSKASHVFGTPPQIIGAVWMQENGPPDVETGVLGKTDFIAKNFPVSDWPALETARTLNYWTWKWLTETEEGKQALKKALLYTSKPYTNTNPEENKVWTKNVLIYEARIRKEGKR